MAGADVTTTRGFSWVFHAAGAPLCRVEWEAPTADIVSNLRPGELLVALCAATICGSDIHTIDGVRSDPAAPLVLGHEGVGRICALGPNPPPGSANNSTDEHERQPAALGDMITWGIAASCGACVACTDWGLPQKCSHVVKYGHAPWRYDAHASEGTASSSSSVRSLLESLSGCYSTHIVLRRGSAVVRLPEGLPFAIAAPINCALATAVAAVAPAPPSVLIPRAAPLQPPPVGACWIQGAGMLGLWATALAKYVRCARLIVVTDVSAARLATAVSFGADVTVCTAGSGTTEALVKTVQAAVATAATPSVAIATAPVAAVTAGAAPSSLQFPFDLVVEACGAASVVPAGIALVRPGGEYVFVGERTQRHVRCAGG